MNKEERGGRGKRSKNVRGLDPPLKGTNKMNINSNDSSSNENMLNYQLIHTLSHLSLSFFVSLTKLKVL